MCIYTIISNYTAVVGIYTVAYNYVFMFVLHMTVLTPLLKRYSYVYVSNFVKVGITLRNTEI